MTVNEDCPTCRGRCCEYGLEDYRGASRRGAHRSEAFHTCPYCTNGTKPTVWTAEQERATVVAYLRDCAHRDAYRNHNRNRAEALWDAANIVESGEHRREEEK